MNNLGFFAKENIVVNLCIFSHQAVEVEIIVDFEKLVVTITTLATSIDLCWREVLSVVDALVDRVSQIQALRLVEQLQFDG